MTLESSTETIRSNVGDDSGLGATVKFDFGDDGLVFLDGKSVPNSVSNDDGGDADCTIKMSLDNFEKMLGGDLDPTTAFMMGKLKVEGDMSIAMKLSSVTG
jgi:putative sterol carrier protein